MTHIADTCRTRYALDYHRGHPVIRSEPESVRLLEEAAAANVKRASLTTPEQQLIRDGFGWYLHETPGAVARLGTCTPGTQPAGLNRADPDERCNATGIRLLTAAVFNSFGELQRYTDA